MQKLAPGSDADTLQVLADLPRIPVRRALDIGCGTGRQTLALARCLQTEIHAIDIQQSFLDGLDALAATSGLDRWIRTRRLDMASVADEFADVDLLWSECAAYHMGFAKALAAWRPALAPGGIAVVSELTWLSPEPPAQALKYFQAGYPGMRHLGDNLAAIASAGYQVLGTHVLSRAAWIDDYYDKLEPLAESLGEHPEASVRRFAEETLTGIRLFQAFGGSYGYVFYSMQKTGD